MGFYEDAAEFMGYNSGEGGYLGTTYTPQELIDDCVGLEFDNDDLREDIIDCIDDRAWSEPDAYHDTERDILNYHWDYFKTVVKHKVRYMFRDTKAFKTYSYEENASEILKTIGETVNKMELIRDLPNKTKLIRCRQHSAAEKIEKAEQMVSPPDEIAIYPNRMSPAGISMFYCTFDIETAKLETIETDKAGSLEYTTAEFFTNDSLTLVDFTKLPTRPSIFDSKRVKDFYIVNFLHDFVKDLSGPIKHDGKEHIEYVPTQVVTEYFRFVLLTSKEKRIDGIIYPSSKNPNFAACVLFLNHEESLANFSFDETSIATAETS